MASSGAALQRKFKIGQSIFYYRGGRDRGSKTGSFIVLNTFSRPNGEIRYRIRSQNDPSIEYVARQNELDVH
jgi:hypothetical protein